MDSKKKTSPLDIWPPPQKKEAEDDDPRKRLQKPRNKSYVDPEIFFKEGDQAVYEGEQEKELDEKTEEEEGKLPKNSPPKQ